MMNEVLTEMEATIATVGPKFLGAIAVMVAALPLLVAGRHAEPGRIDRDGGRRRVHRCDDGQIPARLRREDRRGDLVPARSVHGHGHGSSGHGHLGQALRTSELEQPALPVGLQGLDVAEGTFCVT